MKYLKGLLSVYCCRQVKDYISSHLFFFALITLNDSYHLSWKNSLEVVIGGHRIKFTVLKQ